MQPTSVCSFSASALAAINCCSHAPITSCWPSCVATPGSLQLRTPEVTSGRNETAAAARVECSKRGMRLCRESELPGCCTPGCSYDKLHVWATCTDPKGMDLVGVQAMSCGADQPASTIWADRAFQLGARLGASHDVKQALYDLVISRKLRWRERIYKALDRISLTTSFTTIEAVAKLRERLQPEPKSMDSVFSPEGLLHGTRSGRMTRIGANGMSKHDGSLGEELPAGRWTPAFDRRGGRTHMVRFLDFKHAQLRGVKNSRLSADTPNKCYSACDSVPRCQAFTFIFNRSDSRPASDYPQCFLKGADYARSARFSPYTISGVVARHKAPLRKQAADEANLNTSRSSTRLARRAGSGLHVRRTRVASSENDGVVERTARSAGSKPTKQPL